MSPLWCIAGTSSPVLSYQGSCHSVHTVLSLDQPTPVMLHKTWVSKSAYLVSWRHVHRDVRLFGLNTPVLMPSLLLLLSAPPVNVFRSHFGASLPPVWSTLKNYLEFRQNAKL